MDLSICFTNFTTHQFLFLLVRGTKHNRRCDDCIELGYWHIEARACAGIRKPMDALWPGPC